MRLYYTAILRFGWGFEGVRMGFWWGFNGIQNHFHGEYDEQNVGFGFPNDEAAQAAPSDPRSCHEPTKSRQPLFWLAAKMGANQHEHGHATDVATFWQWNVPHVQYFNGGNSSINSFFFWRVGLPEESLKCALGSCERGSESEWVRWSVINMLSLPELYCVDTHTHIPIYHYISIFMIIYDYLCSVCEFVNHPADRQRCGICRQYRKGSVSWTTRRRDMAIWQAGRFPNSTRTVCQIQAPDEMKQVVENHHSLKNPRIGSREFYRIPPFFMVTRENQGFWFRFSTRTNPLIRPIYQPAWDMCCLCQGQFWLEPFFVGDRW